MSKLHLLAIGAHIHDAEVMGGAILAKYAASGHKATIIHVTPGEKGHPTLSFDDYEAIKMQEAYRSAKIIGADVLFMPYKDAELPLNQTVVERLADMIRQLRPDIVITHWRGSFHPDHYKTHCIVNAAATKAADSSVQSNCAPHSIKQLFYGENWEDSTGFHPHVLIDISDVYDIWIEAMMQHGLFRGEVSAFAFGEYYRGLTRIRGALARTSRAVALMTAEFASRQERVILPI